jgi:hypothetical protein
MARVEEQVKSGIAEARANWLQNTDFGSMAKMTELKQVYYDVYDAARQEGVPIEITISGIRKGSQMAEERAPIN